MVNIPDNEQLHLYVGKQNAHISDFKKIFGSIETRIVVKSANDIVGKSLDSGKEYLIDGDMMISKYRRKVVLM